jgi:hypothetical protein
MRRDRRSELVAAAVAEMNGAYPAAPGAAPLPAGRGTATAAAYGTAGGAVGGESIQDEDGTLYCMCGVSACGGDDVVAP